MFFNRTIFRYTNVVKISLEVDHSRVCVCVCVCIHAHLGMRLSSLPPSLYIHTHILNYFRSLSHYQEYPSSDDEL